MRLPGYSDIVLVIQERTASRPWNTPYMCSMYSQSSTKMSGHLLQSPVRPASAPAAWYATKARSSSSRLHPTAALLRRAAGGGGDDRHDRDGRLARITRLRPGHRLLAR